MQKILKKIHDVMQDVTYIKKDEKNKFQNYTYASELAIKSALGGSFRKHGIVFKLSTSNIRIMDTGLTDKNNNPMKMIIMDCAYTFYDIDSGEMLEGLFVSSGPARDDKGVWAATTNAIKYILTSTFLIPTGDDSENNTNHPPETKSKKTTKKTTRKTKPANLKAEWFVKFKQHCEFHSPKIEVPDKPSIKAFANILLERNGLAGIATELKVELPDAKTLETDTAPGWLALIEIMRRMVDEGSFSAGVGAAVLNAGMGN